MVLGSTGGKVCVSLCASVAKQIMNIQIINPIEYPNWDELLLTNEQTTFFHTAAWARVLHESYNYKPLYFTAIEDGKLSALIPIMEINSFLTGKRGVSLPFTDESRPIAKNEVLFRHLTDYIFEFGKENGWKHIEFRGNPNGFKKPPEHKFHHSHVLYLKENEENTFSTFKSNVRRNIRKAKKQGVQVILSNTWESVRSFYKLNCLTRKEQGIPPQPLSFFRKIFKHIISRDKGFLSMALFSNIPIAGAVYFNHGNRGVFKYGASDRKYLNLRPNNLVMWEAIRWYCRNHYKTLCFGRTELENKGLLQFKRGWGTKENTMHYYKYNFTQNCFVSKKSGLKSSYNFFKHMPVPILRLTGNLLYRHVG